MNQEHQRDKEQIRAELAKQIKEAVSEIDVADDPAISSIVQHSGKVQQQSSNIQSHSTAVQNPESADTGKTAVAQYKKKAPAGAK